MKLKTYNYSLLKQILATKVDGRQVWKKRVRNQTQFLHLLEDAFSTDISNESFGFYPNKIYFATPLTSDPSYTEKMKPTWLKIIKEIEKLGWNVYAPFTQTDPHTKTPDMLDSYRIRDIDHAQVLTAEVGLMDFNRPSHGVGQEVEMGVFMPTIGFSQERVSRLTKGMPGLMTVNYKDVKELVSLLKKIFQRKNYKSEPFYLHTCPKHPTPAIFKGKDCLHCLFAEHLHTV